MKKAIRVVLWGCVGLLFLGLVVTGGALFYLSQKLDGVVRLEEASLSLSQRQEALERRFPFSRPDSGVFVPADEDRLLRYLQIRRSLFPRFQQVDALNFEISASSTDVEAGMAAATQLARLKAEMPAEWLTALEKGSMSVTEYQAFTDAIYRDYLTPLRAAEKREADVADMRERTEDLKDLILQPGMSDEEMRAIGQQLALLKAQQAQAEPTPDAGAMPAPSNALLERHRAEIESLAHERLNALGW